MATITPTISRLQVRTDVVWSDVSSADTATAHDVDDRDGVYGSVQFAGTFGGATVVMQASNDNANWHTLTDTEGADVQGTAAAFFEFGTAARYLRPSVSGGSGDAVNVAMTLRGETE